LIFYQITARINLPDVAIVGSLDRWRETEDATAVASAET